MEDIDIYPARPGAIVYRHHTNTFLLVLPISARYFDGLSAVDIKQLITTSSVYHAVMDTRRKSPGINMSNRLVYDLSKYQDILTVQYAPRYGRLLSTIPNGGCPTGVWIENIKPPHIFGDTHTREWYVVLESNTRDALNDIMMNHRLVPRLVKIQIGPMHVAITEQTKLIRIDAYPTTFRNRPLVIPGGEEDRLVMMQLLQAAVSKRIEHDPRAEYVGQFTENSPNVVYERGAGKNISGESLIIVHADSLKFDFDTQQITADIIFLHTASVEDEKIWLMYANAQSAYQFIPRVELVEDFKTGEILDVKIRAIDMIKKRRNKND